MNERLTAGISKAGVAALLVAEALHEHFAHVLVRPEGHGDWTVEAALKVTDKIYAASHMFVRLECDAFAGDLTLYASGVAREIHEHLRLSPPAMELGGGELDATPPRARARSSK